MRSRKWVKGLGAALLGTAAPMAAFAQTTTWVGGGAAAAWYDDSNWTNGVPTTASTAIIQGGASSNPILDVSTVIDTLIMNNSGGTPVNTMALSGSTLTANTVTVTAGAIRPVAGPGTLTVTGTLSMTGNSTLGNAANVMTVNAADISLGDVAVISNVTVNASSSITLNPSGSRTFSNKFEGTAGLTVQGGTVTLSGANTYSGGTAINGGTLAISADSNLGAASGGLSFDGGTLQVVGNVSTSRAIQLNDGGGTFDVANSGSRATVSGTISGSGGLTKTGLAPLVLTAANDYTGGTTVAVGTLIIDGGSIVGTANVSGSGALAFDSNASAGDTVITADGTVQFTGTSTAANASLTTNNFGTVWFAGSSTAGNAAATINASGVGLFSDDAVGGTSRWTVNAGGTFDISLLSSTSVSIGSLAGAGAFNLGSKQLTVGGNNLSTEVSGMIADGGFGGGTGGSLVKEGSGTLTLSGNNTYTGGTTLNGGTLAVGHDNALGTGTLTVAGGTRLQAAANGLSIGNNITLAGTSTVDTQANGLTLGGVLSGTGGLTKVGAGTLTLSRINTYTGGTTITDGVLQLGPGATLAPTGALTINGGAFDLAGHTQTVGALSGSGGSILLNGGSLATDSAANTTLATAMIGAGSFTKVGAGTLILAGNNSYSGGTVVAGGILQGNSTSLQGNIRNNAMVVFDQTGIGTYAGVMSGSGSMTLQGGGVLTMTGNNTYTGTTTVNAGTLAVNGSLASTVTLNNGGLLGGSGMIGGLVASGGIVAPGNSIGTLTVNGNFTQNSGVYQVEANAQGQSDRIVAAGTATINGGTVQVLAQPGNYATSTTYTILTATGGVSGAYAGATSDFAFMTPSLSYDANNVFLTLALQGPTPFSGFGGNTLNQRAVGYALDQSYVSASGDFATVIGALANLSTAQGAPTLNQISGQPYADFGTTNVNTSAMFMNTLGQQMALARGGQGTGQRQALAMACEVEACDTARPLSAWFSGLGGLGSVQGNTNTSTLTYNFGGAATGIDYRLNPMFLVGLGVGYTHGTQWVQSFQGKGWSDSVNVAAYGSFTYAGFYADALAGYAYFNNQMQRQISVPGLQPRTASGSTGANQFLTQLETGYALPVFGAKLTTTPFARLQFSTTSQNGFNESGAQSLSLNVAQQTTSSLRTVLGAELASNLPLSSERSLGLALRLGWQHEYDDTGRPITAAFSGAPSAAFTVYGATPTRDAAIVGFSVDTTVADSTQLYLRYDGTLASGTDNHAFTAGLRLSW